MDIYKKCKVVMIPTDDEAIIQPGELFKSSRGFIGLWLKDTKENTYHPECTKQYLYILSDGEIEENDWILYDDKSVVKFKMNDQELFKCYKVIASTDLKLNLPSPSQAFVKKYVELGGIDEIMVQFSKETITLVDPPSGWKYGFPKQGPAVETDILKWFVEQGYPQSEIDAFGDNFIYGCSEYPVETLKVSKNNTITIRSIEIKNSFSRLEVIALLDKFKQSKVSLEKFVKLNM